jgi:hypothetical protein
MKKQSRHSIGKSILSLLVSYALSIGFCQASQAQVYKGGFAKDRVKSLRWFSPLPKSYIDTYIAPGAKTWNGIYPHINTKQVSTKPYDVLVVTRIGSKSGVVGDTIPICQSATQTGFAEGEPCIKIKNWFSASVVGYTNKFPQFNLTKDQIINIVYAHEFGHTLSLDHSFYGGIMTSGITNVKGAQEIDKLNLRTKWGSK